MPDYVKAAKRAARKYGIDPDLFARQINAESGFNPNAGSPAGARGIAQFMPATAKGYGVNLNDGRASDDLDGAARHMRDLLRQFGSYEKALRAYNAGPGAVQKSYGYDETNRYVQKILNGQSPRVSEPKAEKRPTVQRAVSQGDPAERMLALQSYTENRGKPTALLELAQVLKQSAASKVAETVAPDVNEPVSSSGGPDAALSWAKSKVGFKETGENSGGLASYLNKRFGFSNAPWCAMFTSAAVTKGGAPASARTASVEEVRRKAAAGVGYEKGYVNPARARKGDLILWGNRHIGMVESVKNGRITIVAGNDSDGVQRRQVPVGDGDIVRPKYRG